MKHGDTHTFTQKHNNYFIATIQAYQD